MTPHITRRRFLQIGGGLTAGALTGPIWLRPGTLFGTMDAGAVIGGKKLLVLMMGGGNDGLNTVIPYTDPAYYKVRSTDLTYPPGVVLPVSATLGLNPKLPTLKNAFTAGHCAIVLGVGYPNHDLSHFGSMDVWQTGSPTHAYGSGWLGRYLDLTPANGSVVRAAAIGYTLPQALTGDTTSGVDLPSFAGFVFADGSDADHEASRLHTAHLICASAQTTDPIAAAWLASDNQAFSAVRAVRGLGLQNQPWPRNLADQVGMAVQLLGSNLGCNIAFVSVGSFDDHASEKPNHEPLLAAVDAAVGRFLTAVAATPDPADYLMMTFSEFGRRVEENGNGGTDHGTAAPLFVVGDAVKGGIYGAQPSLTSLDPDGNMISSTDFREVYIPLIDSWLGGVTSQQVLGYTSSDNLTAIPFI